MYGNPGKLVGGGRGLHYPPTPSWLGDHSLPISLGAILGQRFPAEPQEFISLRCCGGCVGGGAGRCLRRSGPHPRGGGGPDSQQPHSSQQAFSFSIPRLPSPLTCFQLPFGRVTDFFWLSGGGGVQNGPIMGEERGGVGMCIGMPPMLHASCQHPTLHHAPMPTRMMCQRGGRLPRSLPLGEGLPFQMAVMVDDTQFKILLSEAYILATKDFGRGRAPPLTSTAVPLPPSAEGCRLCFTVWREADPLSGCICSMKWLPIQGGCWKRLSPL